MPPATAPRKSPRSTSENSGFFRAFRAITFDLPSRVGYAAHVCACVILAETLADYGRQLSQELTEEDFAIAIHGAEEVKRAKAEGRDLLRGVRYALDEISIDPEPLKPKAHETSAEREKREKENARRAELAKLLPFIRIRSGRGYRYKPADDAAERIRALPQRQARTLKSGGKAEKAKPEAKPIPITLACPLAQNCPVSEVYETEAGGLTNIRETGDTGTPVPVSGSSPGPHRNSSSGMDPRLEELHQAIDVICAAVLHKVPDDPFLRRVLEQLGDAPIPDFAAMLRQEQQKLARYGSGLLPKFAGDVRAAHEKLKASAPQPVARLEVDRAANRETAQRILADPASTPAEREWAVAEFPDLAPREAARQEAARLLTALAEGFAGKPLPPQVAAQTEARLARIDQQFPGLVTEVRASRASPRK